MSSAYVEQSVSGSTYTVPELNIHSASFSKPSTAGSAILYPIMVASDGSYTRSAILTWRLHIAQPFTYVHSVQFWFDDFTVPANWKMRLGITSDSNSAVVGSGRPVSEFMDKQDLDADPPPFNLMAGYETNDYPNAETPNTPVTSAFTSQYVHMWAEANGDAPAGPMLGYSGVTPVPMTVNFSWVEL